MGSVIKVLMRFRERFWEEHARPGVEHQPGNLVRLDFLLAPAEEFPIWWTTYPIYAPVLTAWAAGPAAERLASLEADALVDRALESLGRMFGMSRSRFEVLLDGWHFHNWQTDPFSRGAYSYIGVDGIAAQDIMAEPVEGTLFFAGEALERHGHHAMVHGAMTTGRVAARQVLASIRR
jgi:monoamine oxidase